MKRPSNLSSLATSQTLGPRLRWTTKVLDLFLGALIILCFPLRVPRTDCFRNTIISWTTKVSIWRFTSITSQSNVLLITSERTIIHLYNESSYYVMFNTALTLYLRIRSEGYFFDFIIQFLTISMGSRKI